MWGPWCQKYVFRHRQVISLHSIPCNVITYPCPWDRLIAMMEIPYMNKGSLCRNRSLIPAHDPHDQTWLFWCKLYNAEIKMNNDFQEVIQIINCHKLIRNIFLSVVLYPIYNYSKAITVSYLVPIINQYGAYVVSHATWTNIASLFSETVRTICYW